MTNDERKRAIRNLERRIFAAEAAIWELEDQLDDGGLDEGDHALIRSRIRKIKAGILELKRTIAALEAGKDVISAPTPGQIAATREIMATLHAAIEKQASHETIALIALGLLSTVADNYTDDMDVV